MSLVFDGSNQYAEKGVAPVTGYPLTMAAWFVLDTDVNRSIVSLAKSGDNNNFFALAYKASNNTLCSLTRGGVTNYYAYSGAVTLGAVHHGCAVLTSATDRAVWLDGGTKGISTDSVTPANLNRTSIGRIGRLSPIWYWDGWIAHVAMWNEALTEDEVVALSRGVNPQEMRPHALKFYAPCWGFDSKVLDLSGGGNSLTKYNGPTRGTTDPPIIIPSPRQPTWTEELLRPIARWSDVPNQVFASAFEWGVPAASARGIDGVGCDVCPQTALGGSSPWVHEDGERWIRPHFTRESRDAGGRHRAVLTAVPVRVPRWWLGQMAQCYQAGGKEFFDRSYCNCPKRGCAGTFGFATWPLESCAVTVGSGEWPPTLICSSSMMPEFVPLVIPATHGRLNQAMFVSAVGSWRGNMGGGCTSNLASLAWGHIEGTRVPCPVPAENLPLYYQGNYRLIFDWLGVRDFTGRFQPGDAPERAYVDMPIVELKNRVLDYVGSDLKRPASRRVLKLDQLDSARRELDDFHNVNPLLDWFGRSFNDANSETHLPFNDLPVVATFPNSFLKHSGCKLSTCEYIIVAASLELSVYLHRTVDWGDWDLLDPPTDATVRPSVSARLIVNMGVRAALEGGSCQFHGTTLSLSQRGPAGRFPRVEPVGADEIVYVDEKGRRLVPPNRVTWWGELGPFSEPPWPVWSSNTLWGWEGLARPLSKQMAGLQIPAFGTHQDSRPGESSQQVYKGSLEIDFVNRCSYWPKDEGCS